MSISARPLVIIALAGFAGLATLACDQPLTTLAGPTPDLTPTFSTIQRDIFESTDVAGRVACTNCHTSARGLPAGGLSLDHDAAYRNLVGVSSVAKPGRVRVVPGDPDGSYLVHKLEGGPDIAGRRMPFSGPPYLTDGQLLILRRWIQDGAANN
jgi:hypothetical protein